MPEGLIDNGEISWGMVNGPVLAIAGIASTLIGTAVSAQSSLAAAQMATAEGQSAEQLGQYQQQQYAQEAETSVARAQRKMLDQNLKTRLVQSQLQARAAGSGVSPSVGSPDILAGQIASRGTFNSLMDLSQGEDLAAGYYNMGAGAKYQGDLGQWASNYQASADRASALGTIAGGAGSMFSSAYKAFGSGFG